MSLQEWLAGREDRCPAGFHAVQHPTQCACEGQILARRGMAIASAAKPDDRAAVDAAIHQLAATAEPFSANDARAPVVGAAFQAAARAGLIKKVGFEPSTDPATHAHPVATWRGRAA